MKVIMIALNTFREALRNKILYSVLFFALAMIGVSALYASVSMGSQIKVVKDFGLFSLSFFGAIIAILAGVSLLNKEIKQKTIYNILSKPVSRWQFILGKQLGLTATVSLLVGAMGLCLMIFCAAMEGSVDWMILSGIFFAVMEVSIVASVTIFFSSMVVTVTLSGLFALGVYICGRSINQLDYFFTSQNHSNEITTAIISFFKYVLPDLSVLNVGDRIVDHQPIELMYYAHALGYSFFYSATIILLAVLIFEKREMV